LRANAHNFRHTVQSSFEDAYVGIVSGYAEPASIACFEINSDPLCTELDNKAIARFTGKVRKHHASLGVTLGSIKQSRDMLTDRTQKLASFLSERVKAAERLPAKVRRRKMVEGRAGDILEWEFGWVPLVEDIKAGLDTLSRDLPPGWMSARATARYYNVVKRATAGYTGTITTEGTVMSCLSGRVQVTNPNLFLANRLGLLNLPGVAWDLIPWSFVVNMFTNAAQMINSVTDFIGVACDNMSMTRTSFVERKAEYYGTAPVRPGMSKSDCWEKRKRRVTSSGVPAPKFELRVPELNLELAVIASSLILQRTSRLNVLFGAKPYS